MDISVIKRVMMGDIEAGEIIEINMRYFRAIAPFNIYSHAAKMRWSAPNAKYDDLVAWLSVRGYGFVLTVNGDEVSEYTYNKKGEVEHLGGSVPLDGHPINVAREHPDVYSFLIDRYTPVPSALTSLDEHWPDGWRKFSTQHYAMVASLLDAPKLLHLVYDVITGHEAGYTDEEIFDFTRRVERAYTERTIQIQIEGKGYIVLGKASHEGDPAVFYTLGLYDSPAGRDLLYVTQEPDYAAMDTFNYVATELQEGTSLEVINEFIKEFKFSVSVRNLKSYPKHAFEYASKDLPVFGVYQMTKR